MTRRICLLAAMAAAACGAFGGPKVSIIGDSYSTYQSWGATYYPNLDVRDISQQWWSQVIAGIDGASLEVNASWSGARMSGLDTDGGATTFSSFLCRARLIGNPDVILICGAMNDDWNGVSTNVLERDVELMFNDLDRNHPLAKKFFVLNAENAGGCPGLKPATRECILGLCLRHYYPVVDLKGVLNPASSADYLSSHPTAAGMTKIANAVLAKYADCEQNGYPVRPDAEATVDADGLFTVDDTTYTCEMVGDEYVVTFTNITHAITFTPLVPIDISRILVVGGGGAGGFSIGGGGGGGEVRDLDFGELGLDADESATIIVGQGGYEPLTKAKAAGETDKCTWGYNHGEGGTSSITLAGTTYAALGGGAGGSWHAEKGSDGANGGGGAGTMNEPRKGGASVNGGHSGGDVYAVGDFRKRAPGGGGGAGGDGQTPTSETVAGDGGAGVTSNISGVNRVYGAGGGGGIGNNTTTPGAGGTNAGSGASANNAKGGSAVDGFGGGGGGGGYDVFFGYAGGNGGNGTVIIRYSPAIKVSVPEPRIAFRGVKQTSRADVAFDWHFISKGDGYEDATLEACDVYVVYSNRTTRAWTNLLATVDVAVRQTYRQTIAPLAPGRSYEASLFAVNRYRLANGETASFVSEKKTFSFVTLAETDPADGLTEVAYLESTGTQYIKTGIHPSADLRIAGRYQHLAQDALTGNKWVTVFGYFNSTGDGLCLWLNSDANATLRLNRPSILETVRAQAGEIYDFESSGASLSVNGKDYASSAAYNCTQSPDLPLFAFYYNNGYMTCNSKVRLYGFKIWQGENYALVRDFVPVKKTATGEAGLFDLVTKTFFGNDGSGAFVTGDEVKPGAGRVTTTFSLDSGTFDGSAFIATLTQQGGRAGDIWACSGPDYGGDSTNGWQTCRKVGAFAEGMNAITVAADADPDTVYVRFYSEAEDAWSQTVFLPEVEVNAIPEPVLSSPVPREVSLSRLSFDVCLSFAGTGADGCDVFSVVTVGGSSVTNLLATGAQVGATLSFEVSPVRPEAVYGIQCFATNSLPGGFGASTCVDVAAPAFGESLSIPADAEEIEYLESSGTQYVLTGVTPSANLRIAGKYEVLPAVALTDGKWVTIFGYFSSQTDGLCLWHGSGYQNLMFNRPSLLKTESIVEGRIYEFETSGASMTVNGTLYSSSAAYNCSQTPDLPLFAFYAPYYGGYTTCGSHVRLYSFKIWDGETLVRDFVPVRDPSGVACFYDQVEGAYHYNAGRGAFIEGPVRKGGLVVTAEPAELGEASPAYGVHHCAEAGLGVECVVTAPAPVGTRTTVCTGWELFRNAGDGLWESVGSGSGSSMALTNDLTQTHKLVWQFTVLDVADVEPPVLKRTLAGGADFEISVNGLGLSSSTATLRLVYGYPPDRLSVTNVVATDVRSFTKHRASVGNLQPGGVFLAKAVLENDAGEVFESAPVVFLTDTVAAAADLAAGYGRIAYLESDGRQRVDTGIEPGADTAVDFAFETLAYKNGTTFFGAKQWDNYQYLFIEQDYGGSPYFRFYDSQKNVAPFVANAAYELSLSADGTLILSKEGVAVGTLESVSRSAPAGRHLNVFDVEDGGHGGSFRFKSMRITKDYSLVRDFIPALRASDGEAGLYDRVTGNFFPSVTNPFPQQSGRAIFSAEQTEEGFRLELSAGSADAELFCALGGRGAGADVAEWASVVPIGTAAAAATSVTVSAPAEWGPDARCARFFAVTGGGVTNWGPVAVWTDPATPDVRNVTADGRGGDVLVVRGTVASFGGADCRLRVLIGTAFDTLVAYDGLDGATLTQPGDFMLTVGDADISAVKLGTDYHVIVDAVSGGAVVQTEAAHVTTAGAEELTAAIATLKGRVATFSGTLGDLGVNGKAVVRLYVGEGEEESGLTAVGEPLAVTVPGPFEVSCKFAEFGKTYSVQLRVVITTANGVPLEMRSALLAVDSPPDTATYVWKQDVAEGDWCDVANWTPQEAVDCAGSPQTASASARFAAGTKAKVRLDRALAIKSLDLDAANLDLVFTGGATNRLTTSSLVLGKLEDGEVRGSRIVFDDAAVTAKDDPLYLGNGSELTFRNGADFLAEQSLYTQLDLRADPSIVVTNRVNVLSGASFTTQNGIGLSGGTVFTVDDAKLTFKNIYFNEHIGGGWLRIAGRHPLVTGSDTFRTAGNAKDNKTGGLVFTVPAGGYVEIPLRYTSDTERRFGGASEGSSYEPMMVYVDPKSPAYSYGKKGMHNYALVKCAKAIAVENIGFGSLERRRRQTGTFLYSRTETPAWEPVEGFTEEDEPLMIGVSLETVPSMMIQLR